MKANNSNFFDGFSFAPLCQDSQNITSMFHHNFYFFGEIETLFVKEEVVKQNTFGQHLALPLIPGDKRLKACFFRICCKIRFHVLFLLRVLFFLDPSDQNEVYHTPLLSKTWDSSQRFRGLEWSSQQNPNKLNVGKCSIKLPNYFSPCPVGWGQ